MRINETGDGLATACGFQQCPLPVLFWNGQFAFGEFAGALVVAERLAFGEELAHRALVAVTQRIGHRGQTKDNTGEESLGMLHMPAVPSTEGLTGGTVPPRLIDEHLVVIGGLLHDIGTYFLLKQDGSDGEPLKFDGPHYVQHGLKGYEYLLNEGVDESIAQFARNHTGVGLTRETVESQGLPLPPADYVPMNLEQEVVMVADKYNSKSIPPKFLTAEAYTRKAARFGESNKREWLRLLERYGVLDVKPLAEQYHMRIAE